MYLGTVRYLLICVFVVAQFGSNECWGSRGGSRPSPSRPTYHPRPSPTYHPRPSPTYHPSPTYRPFPRPSPTYRPFPQPSVTSRPFPHPSPTYRPFPQPAPTYRPFPQPSPTYRPFPQPGPTYRPFPSPTSRPFPSHPTPRPSYPTSRPAYPTNGPNRYPTRYPTQPTRYPTQRYPVAAPTRAPTHHTTHRQTTTRAPTYRTTERHSTRYTTHRTTSARRTTSYPITTTPWHTTTSRHTTSARRTTTRAPTHRTTHLPITTMPTTRYTTRRTTHLPITTMPTTRYTTRRTTHLPITTMPTTRYTTRRTTHFPITTMPTTRYTTRRTTHLPITTMPTTRYTHTTGRTTHWPITTMPTTRYTTRWTTRMPTSRYTTTTRRPTHKPTYRVTTTHVPHYTIPGYREGGLFSQQRPYKPTYTVPVRVPGPSGSKTTIININNHHPAQYWAPPSYPVYRYTHRDTGNTALGLYLGYNLGRINHPAYEYHHHNFDGYSPRYDHYTVHHYYHNTGNIPKEQTITTKVIIGCKDNSLICPLNTTALCTASGQIMCVVIANNTVPCKDNPTLQCVRSMVPCENNDATECKQIPKGQSAVIDIPCISNTTIRGNITLKNNTIIAIKHKNPSDIQTSISGSVFNSEQQFITTMLPPLGLTTLPTVQTTLPSSQYCITILAEPSKRELTEGEQVFNEVTNVFDSFFWKAFGMDNMKNSVPALKK